MKSVFWLFRSIQIPFTFVGNALRIALAYIRSTGEHSMTREYETLGSKNVLYAVKLLCFYERQIIPQSMMPNPWVSSATWRLDGVYFLHLRSANVVFHCRHISKQLLPNVLSTLCIHPLLASFPAIPTLHTSPRSYLWSGGWFNVYLSALLNRSTWIETRHFIVREDDRSSQSTDCVLGFIRPHASITSR